MIYFRKTRKIALFVQSPDLDVVHLHGVVDGIVVLRVTVLEPGGIPGGLSVVEVERSGGGLVAPGLGAVAIYSGVGEVPTYKRRNVSWSIG